MPLDIQPYEPNALDIQEAPPLEIPPIPKPRTRTKKEELLRQLGLTAKLGTDIATGTMQAIGGGVAGAANLLGKAGEKIGLPPQQPIANPAQSIAGRFPQPENFLEHGVQFAGSLLGGGMDPVMGRIQQAANALAPASFRPTPTGEQATIEELHNRGVKLLPSQMDSKGGELLQGLANPEHAANAMRMQNKPALQQLAAQATGLPAKNLTDDAISAANREIFDRTYQPVIDALPHIRPGALQRQEIIDAIRTTPNGTARDAIQRRAEDILRPMTTREAMSQIESLRGQATNAFRSSDPNGKVLGMGYRRLAEAMENQIERNLPQNPGLVANFQAGRTAMAKNFAVRDSLVDPTTGIVDAGKMFSQKEAGAPLTGGLDTIAKAGSPMYYEATRPPVRGAGVPVRLNDYAFGGGGGLLGYFLTGGNPIGAFGGTLGAAAIRGGSKKAITSDLLQESMARAATGQPGMFDPLLRRMAPMASYNLGSLLGGQ